MFVVIPITAIFIALFWCVVALLITWGRGYTPRGIVLCLAGIIVGGVGAGSVGSYALSGWTDIIESQNEKVMACAAVLIGALCGLYITERLRDHEFPTPRQLMTAMFGFCFGGMAGLVIFYLTRQTWAERLSLFVLMPAIIGTATLAGSAISHRLPDV